MAGALQTLAAPRVEVVYVPADAADTAGPLHVVLLVHHRESLKQKPSAVRLTEAPLDPDAAARLMREVLEAITGCARGAQAVELVSARDLKSAG